MFVEYSFQLELYDEITFWDVNVKRSCVEIGIHKRTAGLWPRLLRDAGRRLPWLTFDVEHSVLDSSDDDSDSDVDSPLVLVSRKCFLLTPVHRVPTGQAKLEKVREFQWSGKGQRKIFFWKSQGK